MRRIPSRFLAAAVALAALLGACSGDESSDTTAPEPDPMADAELTVTCEDATGDAAPFPGMEATDEVIAAADLASVTLTGVDDGLEVRVEFAGSAELAAGNRGVTVRVVPVSGDFPNADLQLTQVAGADDRIYVTLREDGEDAALADTDDLEARRDGSAVTFVVPYGLIEPAIDVAWRWDATATSSIEESIAQDACGSDDASPEAEIVHHPGVRRAG